VGAEGLEVQSQHDPAFARRMFRYHARLFDRYQQEVVSLAVLGDTRPGWRPDRFGYGRWGCELRLTFPIVKLVEFDRTALEASANPFATVVLAHLDAQATRADAPGRARAKFALTRRLYGLGYDRDAIRRLYRFIDWLLRLPAELEVQTWREIKAFEEEQQMPYITTAERIGRAEGRAEGLLTSIRIVLEARFGEAGRALMPEIQRITDSERLEAIVARVGMASSVEEIRTAIEEGA
jgi:hypothetical protein